MQEKITKLLNESWAGKRFVYRSKYGGEVIGTIESVFITTSFTTDPETSHNFRESIETKSPKGKRKGQEPKYLTVDPQKKYLAIRPEVQIRSTNNQVYALNEIFIISKDNNPFEI